MMCSVKFMDMHVSVPSYVRIVRWTTLVGQLPFKFPISESGPVPDGFSRQRRPI